MKHSPAILLIILLSCSRRDKRAIPDQQPEGPDKTTANSTLHYYDSTAKDSDHSMILSGGGTYWLYSPGQEKMLLIRPDTAPPHPPTKEKADLSDN